MPILSTLYMPRPSAASMPICCRSMRCCVRSAKPPTGRPKRSGRARIRPRQYLLTALVSAHLARLSFHYASPDKPFEIAPQVIEDVERGFSLLTGVMPNLKDFGLAAEFWRHSYGRHLTEFWITAYPRLDKLKLGGRLAPPAPWRDGPDEQT